jgi:predicted transcriptional regulator
VSELVTLAGRAAPNLSRTLKKMHEAGIVDFEQGRAGRARRA